MNTALAAALMLSSLAPPGRGHPEDAPRITCARCNATDRERCRCPRVVDAALTAAQAKRDRKNAARRERAAVDGPPETFTPVLTAYEAL